jgi:hypothetical protein
MRFELEGESERVIRAGEAFWEPGGDVIHYQDGNNRSDTYLEPLSCDDAMRTQAHADSGRRGRAGSAQGPPRPT